MNGIHDMGGMHGMGAIEEETNEPVFHHAWEGRVFALDLAIDSWDKWPGDAERHQIEVIPPTEYLRMQYYEKWLAALVELTVNTGLVTREEVESGRMIARTSPAGRVLTAAEVPAMIGSGSPASRNVPAAPRFQVGQRVRARNMHPVGHTRQPRYVRGKLGSIERDHGVFVFPDANARGLGEKPQHVYSVRYAARELWGEQAAAHDSVYLDMWDDYLEPA